MLGKTNILGQENFTLNSVFGKTSKLFEGIRPVISTERVNLHLNN